MDLNHNSKSIVGLILAVVLFSAIAIPVIGASVDGLYVKTYYENDTSEQQMYYIPISEETSNTLYVTSSGIVTDSATMPIWEGDSIVHPVLVTETLIVSLSGAGVITVTTPSGASTASTSFTAVISAGEITYSLDSAATQTASYVSGYLASPAGSYVHNANQERYYNGTNLAAYRYDSALYVYLNGVGTRDGSAASFTLEGTEVEGTEGQVMSHPSIRYTSTKALNVYIVEKSAVYSTTSHGEIISLIQIVPLLILVGVILSAVGTFLIRRE